MKVAQLPQFIHWMVKFTPILLITILFGCETTSQLPLHSVEYTAHQQKLSTLTQFRVSGKLGYIDPNQRQSLNFTWDQSPQSSQLRLSTFLGKTVLNLTMDDQGASVTDMDGNRYFDPNADQLFYQLTGMRLPIVYMRDWIKGQPTQADHFAVSGNGTLSSLSQTRGDQTWTMDYLNYNDEQELILPNKMTLSRQQIKLNIVINRWNLK